MFVNAVARQNGSLKSTKTAGYSVVITWLKRKQFQKEAGKHKKQSQ